MDLQLPLLRCINGKAPSFQKTLAALGELSTYFYEAMEFGSTHVHQYFEKQSDNEKPRPHIREMILRDQAKRYLQRHHFVIEDEEISLGNEPLAALLVRCGPVQIRILKGRGGLIPGCGESIGRRSFYNQRSSTYMDPRTRRARVTKLNLVLIWDFDPHFNISQLWLACPLRAGEKSADVLTQWLEPIPHPAVIAAHVPVSSDDAQQKADDELERLLDNTNESTDDSAEEA